MMTFMGLFVMVLGVFGMIWGIGSCSKRERASVLYFRFPKNGHGF